MQEKSNTKIYVLDTSAATLILDGELWLHNKAYLIMTVPELGSALFYAKDPM